LTLRVGIIGASFARKAYLPALRHVPGAAVVALASARLDSATAAASAFDVPHAYDDWRAMLAEHQFDLVCIATPTDTHAEMTLAALAAGAAVLCEKPTAMNAAEALQMRDRARELGRVAVLGHELRFNPNRRKIADLISSGAIGEIRHAHIAGISNGYADPGARPKGDWWSLAERGGGRLGANGSHQVDMLRWWFGEALAVMGRAVTMVRDRVDKRTGERWTATADDVVHMVLEMENAPFVDTFLSGVARHDMDNVTRVFGSDGTIVLANSDESLLLGKPGSDFEDISVEDPNAQLEGIGAGIWNVSYVGLLQELCEALSQGRQPRGTSTFEDGWRNQVVLDAVKRSGDERRWIELQY
jgi:predicted dehydrogenase